MVSERRCRSLTDAHVVFSRTLNDSVADGTWRFTIGGGKGQRQCLLFEAEDNRFSIQTGLANASGEVVGDSMLLRCEDGPRFAPATYLVVGLEKLGSCTAGAPVPGFSMKQANDGVAAFRLNGADELLWSCHQPL